mgnify:CR=1 FL=1
MESVGGQAIIEGVLIKKGSKVGIAVRNTKGKIITKEKTIISLTKKYKILNIPIIRGPIILFETMSLGIKALNDSANIAIENNNKDEKLGTWTIISTLIFSILFALIIFKLIPLGIAQLASFYNSSFENKYLFNLIEGVSKFAILFLYLYLISFMPDVKRVFQYHGAEHKVVNAYENNDLRNAQKYSRIHVRCGTSFIFFVLFVSIIVYIFLPIDVSFLAKYGLRILLLPFIAGISYELIKLSPKIEKNIFFKIILSPGLLLQQMTTREPTNDQIEVAKAALKIVS